MIKKKNREFDKKCLSLKNRIKILKKEKENYQIKLKNLKKKEEKGQKVQNDKIKIKLELDKKKEEKNEELIRKKELIQNLKKNEKNALYEKKRENLSAKKELYKSALNDKDIMKKIIEQMNDQQNNKNCFKRAKVKQQFYEYETNKIRKNILRKNKEKIEQENNLKLLKIIEQKMMQTYNNLEIIEKKCLEDLNKTKYINTKFIKEIETEGIENNDNESAFRNTIKKSKSKTNISHTPLKKKYQNNLKKNKTEKNFNISNKIN